ncbi:hypothetical protein Dsin_007278 [Dipteronia sinensis]|uniref:Cation/H+ exchanger domain-containing protein n=1 Tax=Dipteronia sinensis TaxID=43782 RepID=A0AAE0B078_9ROSI|nr:hypothetical protein Dsin_007278 [Dipteronia sinensis]
MVMFAGSVIGEMDLIDFPLLYVLLPVALVTCFAAIFRVVLKPLGQVNFVSQMLAGIVLGPSCLGQTVSNKLYTMRSISVLNVFQSLGLIYILFLLSVRIDVGVVRNSGRLAIIIGLGAFFAPMVATLSMWLFIKGTMDLDTEVYSSFPVVASIECTISFHMILTVLTDLKLLNSELGRLALSSTLVSNIASTVVLVFGAQFKHGDSQLRLNDNTGVLMSLSSLFIILVIVFVCRPIMFWMMKQTPDGKPLKQVHLVAINVMVLGSALLGEILGQHYLIGPAILGIVTPTSSPLGSALAEKMECFNWVVFIPCYIANIGRLTDLNSIGRNSFLAIGWLILVSMFARFFAIIIISIYYKLPIGDAISLSLLLNCRGLIDTLVYAYAYVLKVLTSLEKLKFYAFNTSYAFIGYNNVQLMTREVFGILMIAATLRSAVITPLISATYDSSRRYVAYRRRTIQHSRRHPELRILACIYEPDNVPTIVNILEASNRPQRSVALHVMKLEELAGGTMPQVITHRLDRLPSSHKSNKADPMINAFRQYEEQKTHTIVQCFTVIAPYATMHDEICLMAFEKSTPLVIIPIQKPKSTFVKTVVRNVLQMSPCSVGILLDRGMFMDPRPIFSRRLAINTCVIFVGGQDDREALAYGANMAETNTNMLKIIRLVAMNHMPPDLTEEGRDLNMLNEFRTSTLGNKNVEFIEKNVTEGCQTAKLLKSIGNEYDLILVGRRHNPNSPVLVGLSAWSEIQELGVIGDLLVSSDYCGNASVLVLQQQASVVQEMIESPKSSYRASK